MKQIPIVTNPQPIQVIGSLQLLYITEKVVWEQLDAVADLTPIVIGQMTQLLSRLFRNEEFKWHDRSLPVQAATVTLV